MGEGLLFEINLKYLLLLKILRFLLNQKILSYHLNLKYDLNKKAINVDWSSMFVYFTFMQRIEGDFGFYPLVRNDFNLSKSNIFAIECIANGMPVLADSYFPEFDIPGVIHYDNPAQFLQRDIFKI